jgi:acid phosphatase
VNLPHTIEYSNLSLWSILRANGAFHHSAARAARCVSCRYVWFFLLAFTTLAGCATTPPLPASRASASPAATDDRLDAILWQTTSAEYLVLTQSIYAGAQAQLEGALADRQWTALPAQKENYQNLPPAVIMDIDETVIDTGRFQSYLVKNRARFSSRPWREWLNRNEPQAVPGAVEFIANAQSRGVTVFFVTNRDHATEQATRLNLTSVGIKLPDPIDTVLSRNQRPDWGSDKESRRRFIAQSYRVIMLFGDDLADFIPEYLSPPQVRVSESLKHNQWGTKWFMLPNPMYGSWEASLYEFRSDLSAEETSKRKFERLR